MDATISVICFKSKTLANGEHPLMLRITKDRKRTMKSLGVSVHPSNWDFDRNEPKPKCPDRKYIQQIILKVKSEYQTKLLEKAARDEDYTAETLVKEQSREQIQSETVESFYLRTVEQLKREGAVGNAYAYLNSYNVLKSFNADKPLSYTFGQIDEAFLSAFEGWMRSKGNKETTLSFQMRTLRDIAKRLKIKATVTTYVARHSYAGVQKSGVGAVVSCDAAGNQRWVFTPDPAGKIDFSGPVLGADGTVYISVNKVGGQIAALDGQTGRRIWQYLCADGFGGTPAVDCYGNIHCGDNAGWYHVVKPDGTLLFKKRLGTNMWSSPVIADDGMVYVNLKDGAACKLIAFDMGLTGPANSPWPQRACTAAHMALQR